MDEQEAGLGSIRSQHKAGQQGGMVIGGRTYDQYCETKYAD